MINELSKEEKICFLQMVYLAETVDGVLDEKEEEIFRGYADKLGVECFPDDFNEFKKLTIDEVLKELKGFDRRKKKIIFSEIVGVLFSDGVYDDLEKGFMQKLGKEIGFDEDEIAEIEDAVCCYMAAYEALVGIVNK